MNPPTVRTQEMPGTCQSNRAEALIVVLAPRVCGGSEGTNVLGSARLAGFQNLSKNNERQRSRPWGRSLGRLLVRLEAIWSRSF